MQNEFPKMLYKAGGPEQIHGGRFHTHIVNDGDELEAALAGGWHKTTPAAVEAANAAAAATTAPGGADTGKQDDGNDDDAPATRDELKAKATQLGLTFAPNIKNAKLAEMIEAALAGGKPQE